MLTFLKARRRLLRVIGITAGVSVFALATAVAAFKVSIADGVNPTVVVTDNGPGDVDPLVGSINWTGNIGVFHVTVVGALSKPIIGSAGVAKIDMTVSAVNLGGAGTLTTMATDTGFTGSGHLLSSAIGGTLSVGQTDQADAYTDGGNVEFGLGGSGGAHANLGLFTGPGPFAGSATGVGTFASPFSLTVKDVTTSGAVVGGFSFDHSAEVTPEGSSLAMLLPGLAPLGLILRRRMKKA